MTIREWLQHLWCWVVSFPLPREDDHIFVGVVGEDYETCLTCRKTVEQVWNDA